MVGNFSGNFEVLNGIFIALDLATLLVDRKVRFAIHSDAHNVTDVIDRPSSENDQQFKLYIVL